MKQATHLSDLKTFHILDLTTKLVSFTAKVTSATHEMPKQPLLSIESVQFANPKGRTIFSDFDVIPHYGGFDRLTYTTRNDLRLLWCQKVPISRDFLRIFNFHSSVMVDNIC